MTLRELKDVYGQCRSAIAEWAEKRGPELNDLIQDAQTRDGAVALEILESVPAKAFTDEQLDKLFQVVVFWIQGPSRLYSLAVRLTVKHARVLLVRLENGFMGACRSGDDSLVRGYCHVFSLLDIELQCALKKCVTGAFVSSNSDIREAIQDLVERCRVFEIASGVK